MVVVGVCPFLFGWPVVVHFEFNGAKWFVGSYSRVLLFCKSSTNSSALL